MILPRRRFLLLAAGTAGAALVPVSFAPARAEADEVAALIRELAGEGTVKAGKVKLDVPLLVENGNTVATSVVVDAPLTGPGRVASIHIFADRNPLPKVAAFHFGPRSGRPQVATRIRLVTSQTVTAVARLADGSCWKDEVELLVTLAACLE
ncbi:MAG: SoxY-related AACIE arm protein [Alphaproteobacteria bacterium]